MFKSAKLTAASLCLTAALGPVVTAAAQARTVSVHTADLNLATGKGQRTLDRRIARASASVCTTGAAYLDHSVRRSERVCREATVRAATAQAADGAMRHLAVR